MGPECEANACIHGPQLCGGAVLRVEVGVPSSRRWWCENAIDRNQVIYILRILPPIEQLEALAKWHKEHGDAEV